MSYMDVLGAIMATVLVAGFVLGVIFGLVLLVMILWEEYR